MENGARLCTFYSPDYIRCTNTGFSHGQVIWACTAKLSNGVSFDAVDIGCETWPGTSPSQGIVILGSCGLKYTLRRR